MKIFTKLKNLALSIENSLSKEHSCISCGREILDGSDFQLCDNCLKSMQKIDGLLCLKCGEMLEDGNLNCKFCENFDYAFNSNRSIVYYNDVSSKIVKDLKYNGRKYYAKFIARLMVQDKSIFEGIDMLTFVPISKERRKSRGFNQAEEIAIEISKLTNIEVKECLIKTKDNKHQAELSQKERLKNLTGTFELAFEMKSEIKSKKILLIDDVFTTGATLSECARVLKTAKPKVINTLTFAKTKLYFDKLS